MTTATVKYFLVGVTNSPEGQQARWQKAAIVTPKNGKKVITEDASNWFPANTKNRKNLLSACRFLADEPGATSTVFQSSASGLIRFNVIAIY